MKKLLCGVAGATMALSTWAGITTQLDADNDKYFVTVSGNEKNGNVLTAEQVAELGAHELVKLGEGTLYAGDELKAFAGKITISEGYYDLQTTNALGTADGETYVDGGTLVNEIANSQTNGQKPTFPTEKLHLKGTGAANTGALQNKNGNVDFCRSVFLEGETTINAAGQRFDLRGSTFDMKGYDLTVSAHLGGFYFVNLTLKNPGNIVVNGGTFEFQSAFTCTQGCRDKTVTLNNGATLNLWNGTSWVDYGIVFNEGSKLSTTYGDFKEYGTDNRNILYGTNTLNDLVSLSIPKGSQIQLPGKVTGVGGLAGTTKGYLQFTTSDSVTNDFQGGVAARGFMTNGCPVGGVVVYNNHAIPTDGGAVTLTNAVLWKHTASALALPDVAVDGTSWITSSVSSTAISTAKSLTKTGAGTLQINMPLKVTGATDVRGGTLRFAQSMPAHPAGLTWKHYNKPTNTMEYQGIDSSGVSYAYKSWPWESWNDASTHNVDQRYSYEGYIRVPGEEGESVTCNWMTSIARLAKVTIDGVVCCNFYDNENKKDGITVGYARLAMYTPVTLKAGWRKIKVELSNWWDATRGPQANTDKGWAANFAIGVDWQARCVTNTAYYAKLLDPGDGSFLQATDNDDDKIGLADGYRPSFVGPVAFASGTTLDINDYEPYAPLAIPSLAGLPTIVNGSVKVTSTMWTLRGLDLAVGEPLTVAANAALQFGEENSVVTVTGDVDEWRATLRAAKKRLQSPITIVRNVTALKNTFVLDPTLADSPWILAADGDDLTLNYVRGLKIILR